ncbi:MAG: hypothetical protein DDT39_01349 [Firmicutes bacterium]|nr:hypothetical protein [candidate division NPL-UPA2 bacterium]
MSNRSRGQRGEELAAQYLVSQGYAIVCRNYRGERGEIDLIAFRHGLLLFAEVKYRQDLTQGHPAEAITLRKLWLSISPAARALPLPHSSLTPSALSSCPDRHHS